MSVTSTVMGWIVSCYCVLFSLTIINIPWSWYQGKKYDYFLTFSMMEITNINKILSNFFVIDYKMSKKMNKDKVVGPNSILIKVCRCVEEQKFIWLIIKLFNEITQKQINYSKLYYLYLYNIILKCRIWFKMNKTLEAPLIET